MTEEIKKILNECCWHLCHVKYGNTYCIAYVTIAWVGTDGGVYLNVCYPMRASTGFVWCGAGSTALVGMHDCRLATPEERKQWKSAPGVKPSFRSRLTHDHWAYKPSLCKAVPHNWIWRDAKHKFGKEAAPLYKFVNPWPVDFTEADMEG